MKSVKGYVSDYVASLDPISVYKCLPIIKKILFRLLGLIEAEKVLVITPSGTKGVCEIYLAKCSRCGEIYVDYPHGYSKYIECPKCRTQINI